MVNEEVWKDVLDSGLTLDHYFLMCKIKNGVKLPENKRIQGFLNLLTKKDYIKDEVLTEKGLDMVQNCEFSTIIPVRTGKIDMGTWIEGLHSRLQGKLKELTGKTQVTDKINGKGKSYSFLCNPTDLGKVLSKVISLYKLKDYEKIEQTLMRHVESCKQANSWFPVIQYYIYKEGASRMVTELDNEKEKDDTKEQFKITNTKELF